MILEVIIQSFFSGVGCTLLKEWMSQTKKKDETKLRELIRQELEAFVRSSSPVSVRVDDTDITEIVWRLKAREIIEEQLKRAMRRKKEIQDFITEAEHIQGNLLQSSKRLLNAMSQLNGARDDEFTITEKNENASVGNSALQSQLEQLRCQEKFHHERTRDNRTRPHTDPIKSATSMSDDQLLDHVFVNDIGDQFRIRNGAIVSAGLTLIIRFGGHLTTKKGGQLTCTNEKGSHPSPLCLSS